MNINTLFKHWTYRIFAPGTILREKYEAFKELLRFDSRCHEQMAELQELCHGGRREDFTRIRKRYAVFAEQVAGMIDCLDKMSPGGFVALKDYFKKFDFYIRFLLAPVEINFAPPYVLTLGEISATTENIGNKAKNLALLGNELNAPVPGGFAVTVSAFHYLVEYNDLRGKIDEYLSELNIESTHSLAWISEKLHELILSVDVPADIEQGILKAYDALDERGDGNITVAVRSSAVSEDGACSFAGQYKTLLGVTRKNLIRGYLEVLASKYTPEALFYRISYGLTDEETAMSVLIIEMVQARASGVLYTSTPVQDAEQQHQESMQLHAIRGLGELLVSGSEVPDMYTLTKDDPPRIIHKKAGKQHRMLVDGGEKEVETQTESTDTCVISDNQAEILGKWGILFEQYYSTPQDIEWAINPDGKLYFLQSRPLHIASESLDASEPIENSTEPVLPGENGEPSFEILLDGCERASSGVSAGFVYQIGGQNTLADIPAGAVLVTRDTPPSYVQVMNRLAAVVADSGSRASHFATVAREFGVPFLTGTGVATDLLEHGREVTVDGDHGVVYAGKIESLIQTTSRPSEEIPYFRILSSVLSFITPLKLVDPAGENFIPEGCRSMHDIIRFSHEKAVQSMFTAARPGTGRGALKFEADIPLDVFLFDVGGGFSAGIPKDTNSVALDKIASRPFLALWKGLSHSDVQWKQKPFDWDAYDKIELAGGIPPKRDSFAFASYGVVGPDYLHFNIRFGYHFTIVDSLCGENADENYCILRFAGGGGDFDHKSLRIDFITLILEQLGFTVEKKGDLLEARLQNMEADEMMPKLDMLGRLLGATKLMDMILESEAMVAQCVKEFFEGRYSFSQEG